MQIDAAKGKKNRFRMKTTWDKVYYMRFLQRVYSVQRSCTLWSNNALLGRQHRPVGKQINKAGNEWAGCQKIWDNNIWQALQCETEWYDEAKRRLD
ncbi:hypothetical protein [Desulfonatronospira thiodismutans]|uniref:hypothetical protein n=1 Tax=Desulfonatronospira thiodismutans TaxID=488939 RepID=UPI00058D2D8E|nr:hypothetical protein [Desulfonatronospira thiodismutans]